MNAIIPHRAALAALAATALAGLAAVPAQAQNTYALIQIN